MPFSRPRTSALRSGVTLPFSTPLARKASILPRPFCRSALVDLAHDDLVARLRADLRDARAHQAAADARPTVLIAINASSLDDHRDALAAADAGGGQAVACPAAAAARGRG